MLRSSRIWLWRHVWPARDLWRAAKLGDLEVIRRLIDAGANPNQKKQTLNAEGDTPLHFAAANDQAEAVRVLLELGAEPNSKDNHGSTPLMDAAYARSSVMTLKALVERGANVNAYDRSGFTALTYAAWRGPERNVVWLLSRGADPNLVTRRGTAEVLTKSINGRNREIFDILIQAGAKPENAPTSSPAIQTAAIYGLEYYTRRLLEAGADPNTTNDRGFPTTICAVRGKSLKVLRLLVEAGANLNAMNDENRTALDIAYEIKRKDMIRLLESAGGKRGKDLAKPPAPDPSMRPSWDLSLDSAAGGELHPWPPRPGPATVRLSISCDHALHGRWTVEYRLRRSPSEELEWKKMFPGSPEDDEDEDAEIYAAEIRLEPGATWIELRLSTELHEKPDELLDWKIEVPSNP